MTTTNPILDRNLAALARTNPRLAEVLRRTPARADLVFAPTDDGVPTAHMGSGPTARALASRRRPRDEAERQVASVDVAASAVFVIGGFGLGYHVEALAKRVGRSGLLVVFEPDLGLLRAVLEQIDHSALLAGSGRPAIDPNAPPSSPIPSAPFGRYNVALLTDADDTGAMAQAIQGLEGIVALGVQLVEHAPSRARLLDTRLAGGETADQALARFHERFITLVKGVKLTIVTTLVQIRTTLRNLTQNIDRYIRHPGVDELRNICAGRPAVVVSAGPSLARNVDLLARPGVRDRVVIIAVQTVLKTLLRKGIRPHFVTALDYSDLSSRFYEGLSPADVEGVTLVVEPKVNPAVLESFPGRSVRCTGDAYLDQLLTPWNESGGSPARPPVRGRTLVPARSMLTPGATVAHLAYYLARHLGCDPIALIGQDLAFTDGQYYAAGAAIHNVWSGELNDFQTLESLEWQRIVRMGAHLHRATDVLGRPVFTDEQMNSYRLQFERDFLADSQRSLTARDGRSFTPSVYDCSEGGVRKLHTTPVPLAEFLERFATCADTPVAIPDAVLEPDAPERLTLIGTHLRSVISQARQVRDISDEAAALLEDMKQVEDDARRLNNLIDRTSALGTRVAAIEPAYGMVHLLSQAGALNRMRADRSLQLAEQLDPRERQRRQIERDAANVRALSASALELENLLSQAVAALPVECGGRGEPKLTRDGSLPPTPASSGAHTDAAQPPETSPDSAPASASPPMRSRVIAVVPFDPLITPLGLPRRGHLDARTPIPVEIGPDSARRWPNLLSLTLARLRRCTRLDAIVVLTPDVPATRDAIAGLLRDSDTRGNEPSAAPIEIVPIERDEMEADRRAVAPARLLARECWRSAPGSFTCYDEIFHPLSMLAAMSTSEQPGGVAADAALLVGPDWGFVDPALCDAIIERHQSSPSEFRLVFTQAPPGLAGVLLHASLIRDVAGLRRRNAQFLAGATPESSSIGPFASIGGMLAYVPSAPATDLIAYPVCVSVDPAVRDCGFRLVLDQVDDRACGDGHAWAAARALGAQTFQADARAIVEAAASNTPARPSARPALAPPAHLFVRIARVRDPISGEVEYANTDSVWQTIAAAIRRRADTAITLIGSRHDSLDLRADPINHPDLLHILRRIRLHPESGFFGALSVHLRTGLLATPERVEQVLLESARTDRCDSTPAAPVGGVDVLSVDLMAESAPVYRAVTGQDCFGQCRGNLELLLQKRRSPQNQPGPRSTWWMPRPLVCVRMTRCDEAYAEVETFYNRWMSRADWAVLDPLPPIGAPGSAADALARAARGSMPPRISPLPIPEHARARLERTQQLVDLSEFWQPTPPQQSVPTEPSPKPEPVRTIVTTAHAISAGGARPNAGSTLARAGRPR